MKINSFNLNSSPIFASRQQNLNKAAELVNTKMENQAVALQLSKEGVQRLKVRNLKKSEELQTRIDEGLEKIKQRLNLLSEVDRFIEEIQKAVTDYMENYQQPMEEPTGEEAEIEAISPQEEPVDTAGEIDIQEEASEEAKYIDSLMKELADMLETVEKNKAQREGTAYQPDDSLAGAFREIDFSSDYLNSISLMNKAKSMIRDEIQKLYDQLAEMQKQVDSLLGVAPKNQDSSHQQGLKEMLKEINDLLPQ